MDTTTEKFKRMGARVRVALAEGTPQRDGRQWSTPLPNAIRVNILRDGVGEYFEIRHRRDVTLRVLEVRPKDRHLLLQAFESAAKFRDRRKSHFLCGHDERAWFVAAIPERSEVQSVQDAKDALKPEEVWDSIREFNVPMTDRDLRRTAGFIRQGEWFFIPRPNVDPGRAGGARVLSREPIRRGAGNPHWCQYLFRVGGEQVRVNSSYPNGVTEHEFARLPELQRKRWDWRIMTRNAQAYVKGWVRHRDHATIVLPFWHEVLQNTETRAVAMQHVAFLD